MISTMCAECAAPLKRFPSQIRNTKYGPFCDRGCLGRYRTKHLVKQLAANYKTGSRRSRDYIEVEASWHPSVNNRGYVFLHRLIAEARAGRFLEDYEIVHHNDHNPRNNHWDNLEILTQSEHAKLHTKGRERNEKQQFARKNSTRNS